MAAPADWLILGTRKGLLVLDRAKRDGRVKLHAIDGALVVCLTQDGGGNFPPIDSVRFA